MTAGEVKEITFHSLISGDGGAPGSTPQKPLIAGCAVRKTKIPSAARTVPPSVSAMSIQAFG
jgi:hypothetical protein